MFATNVFSPAEEDADPGLTGLMKVDLTTGVATSFLPENSESGFFLMTDVAVSPLDGMVYVGTQLGGLFRFDAVTGAPLANEPGGFFMQMFGAANDLEFAPDGTLYVAEIGETSSVAVVDPQGVRQANAVSDIAFISGIGLKPNGDLLIANGGLQAPGEVLQWDGANLTTFDNTNFGGILDITLLTPSGDYDRSGTTNTADYDAWAADYGDSSGGPTDGNGDGVVNAADYTLWRDHEGDESRALVTDFFANLVNSFAVDGTDRQYLVPFVPPQFPSELPPNSDFFSNFPSEVILSPNDTLLVSTLGLTRRPDNRASILEYDRDGNLLGVLADGLPPISGIALAPSGVGVATVPEPATVVLALIAAAAACRRAS
ncbi:hypothetical protein [Botrimarina colliarenosi]|uniref:hypothetical protein n=1 Tax=Botrimarina colliarenosi TaxID=2528001 RepID=UPI0011B5A332|nr:hypothetical protein [Botrimarina colliarenosi]